MIFEKSYRNISRKVTPRQERFAKFTHKVVTTFIKTKRR